MSLRDYSDKHLQFTFESLLELQKSYLKLWIPLLLLPYDTVKWLEKISGFFHIQKIFSHEETGNWKTYQRDKKVISYCKKHDIKLIEYPTNGVVRKLKSRDRWNAIWTKRMSAEVFSPVQIRNLVVIPKDLCNISKETKEKYSDYFKTHRNSKLQKWGESEAVKILKNFLEMRSARYMYNISKPFESQSWCSRLSPYITYGCLSLKTIIQATENRRDELKKLWSDAAKNHRKSLQYFISRLHWQSHFIQKLEDEPEIEFRNLNPGFDIIRQEIDSQLIEKVFSSKSGIPYIDAVIRQLQKTGWCNFRSRAILVSFLCNTCLQPWQAVAPRIAQLFTDYEPGIHYPQFQMQAGTTGINTIRIYNPVYNGQQKDPEWTFIYHYIPELKNVPKKYIHEPHLWENFQNLDYPKPIVNIKENNKIAKKLLWEIKWHIPKKQKNKIVEKHASRVFQKMKQEKRKIDIQTSLF